MWAKFSGVWGRGQRKKQKKKKKPKFGAWSTKSKKKKKNRQTTKKVWREKKKPVPVNKKRNTHTHNPTEEKWRIQKKPLPPPHASFSFFSRLSLSPLINVLISPPPPPPEKYIKKKTELILIRYIKNALRNELPWVLRKQWQYRCAQGGQQLLTGVTMSSHHGRTGKKQVRLSKQKKMTTFAHFFFARNLQGF